MKRGVEVPAVRRNHDSGKQLVGYRSVAERIGTFGGLPIISCLLQGVGLHGRTGLERKCYVDERTNHPKRLRQGIERCNINGEVCRTIEDVEVGQDHLNSGSSSKEGIGGNKKGMVLFLSTHARPDHCDGLKEVEMDATHVKYIGNADIRQDEKGAYESTQTRNDEKQWVELALKQPVEKTDHDEAPSGDDVEVSVSFVLVGVRIRRGHVSLGGTFVCFLQLAPNPIPTLLIVS
mmetsp:Transcript_26528/g.58149  ORF Transcript_26528/g.58149 Transcript_26528/m.58149 type:complete len:234 (+) Transcript_26528:130-831(+)